LTYSIKIIRTAGKQILALTGKAQLDIVKAIDSLMGNPRPAGCKKLRAATLWRIRVGDYRVVYAIDDKAGLITVLKVAIRREDTYRGL